jgi:Rad3-related DNA helicase
LIDTDEINLLLKNAIIIFDEAHNVQNTAEEGSSYFISLNDVLRVKDDFLQNWSTKFEDDKKLNSISKEVLKDITAFAKYLEK